MLKEMNAETVSVTLRSRPKGKRVAEPLRFRRQERSIIHAWPNGSSLTKNVCLEQGLVKVARCSLWRESQMRVARLTWRNYPFTPRPPVHPRQNTRTYMPILRTLRRPNPNSCNTRQQSDPYRGRARRKASSDRLALFCWSRPFRPNNRPRRNRC